MRNSRLKNIITAVLLTVLVVSVVLVIKFIFLRPFKMDIVKHFTFSRDDSLKEWQVKAFKGRVAYSIGKADGKGFVRAASDNTASALYYKVKLKTEKRPLLSWKWKVEKFPSKRGGESLKDPKQDDFGARVYVIFPSFFFTKTKALEYIWTESVKEGTISPSPYSKNLQLVVVESGKREGAGWVSEERDIYEDYIEAFGEPPKSDIGAIAFMTDADSTKSSAEALYDEIKIGYKTEEVPHKTGDEQ
ncbi:MAG: DUF3047 domain-containing protein [Candidatus Omnitrophota bacterium]